jgi:hypothetical protein
MRGGSFSMTINKIQYIGSHKIITRLCEAVNALIDTKQDLLTFDQKPEEESNNPVTSSGLFEEHEKLKSSQVQIDENGRLYVMINGTKHIIKEGDDANA